MSRSQLQTQNLTLVPNTPADLRAQIAAMSPGDKAQVSPDWMARLEAATEPDPWTLGFALLNRAGGNVVGTAGFKSPPKTDGVVEIAYGVDSDHRGKGYATEAARALVEFAFVSGRVRLVCAHTLEADAASAHVLTKCGFRCVGQVIDPEDGLVWRWELSKPD